MSTPFSFHFEPKSPSQRRAIKAFSESDLLFFVGPAATGKSFCSLALALKEVHEGRRKKVILTRPIVSASEDLGYLPGDVSEKIEPYTAPLQTLIGKLTFKLPEEVVEFCPLAYMRGTTFEDSVVVCSEAQNCTYQQLKLLITRLGRNSKMIIEGDPEQSDLSSNGYDLDEVISRLENEDGIGVVEFDDSVVMRHPIVRAALRKL